MIVATLTNASRNLVYDVQKIPNILIKITMQLVYYKKNYFKIGYGMVHAVGGDNLKCSVATALCAHWQSG